MSLRDMMNEQEKIEAEKKARAEALTSQKEAEIAAKMQIIKPGLLPLFQEMHELVVGYSEKGKWDLDIEHVRVSGVTCVAKKGKLKRFPAKLPIFEIFPYHYYIDLSFSQEYLIFQIQSDDLTKVKQYLISKIPEAERKSKGKPVRKFHGYHFLFWSISLYLLISLSLATIAYLL